MKICWKDQNVGNHLHVMHGNRGVPMGMLVRHPIQSICWLFKIGSYRRQP